MWFNRNAGTGVIAMTMPTRRPLEEVVCSGKELYQRDILLLVLSDHFGEYAAIDVETGDWAVAKTEREALHRLRALCHGAVDVLMERFGYRALRSFGAGSLRKTG